MEQKSIINQRSKGTDEQEKEKEEEERANQQWNKSKVDQGYKKCVEVSQKG